MSHLRAAVFAAKQVPFQHNGEEQWWSPTSCTLIYDDKHALLVDTATTIDQNEELLAFILKVAPGRILETIYITHGHPDHWFGLPIILKQFPNAKVLATAGSIRHAHENVAPGPFSVTWGAWFGGRIPGPYVFPEELPADYKILLGGKWECQAIEVGHSDTVDTTILWVPELKLVVAGDVVYGEVHQMLAIGTTTEQRNEWLKALDIVESLKPVYVVGGHQQAEEMHGAWTIASSRAYIEDFERLLAEVKSRKGTPKELYDLMMKKYGDRMNPMVLDWSCNAQFGVAVQAKM